MSREGPAAYRVRSYLAAQVSRGRTTIAWVWDVYDRDQQRALRLSGEEPAGKAGRDAWAAADDLVLRRIAQAGLQRPQRHDQRNGAGRCAASRPGAGQRGPAVASAERVPAVARRSAVSALSLQRPLTAK